MTSLSQRLLVDEIFAYNTVGDRVQTTFRQVTLLVYFRKIQVILSLKTKQTCAKILLNGDRNVGSYSTNKKLIILARIVPSINV